jgi:hypothetical protein
VSKRIKLTDVAGFLGITPAFLCEVRYGKKRFSSRTAQRISAETGVPLEQLLFAPGDQVYRALCFCFGMQQGSKK